MLPIIFTNPDYSTEKPTGLGFSTASTPELSRVVKQCRLNELLGATPRGLQSQRKVVGQRFSLDVLYRVQLNVPPAFAATLQVAERVLDLGSATGLNRDMLLVGEDATELHA